jgi:pimeloyl-ACP methyl ester carboxylesterase
VQQLDEYEGSTVSITRTDGTIELAKGRSLAYADYGPKDGRPVLWCHGGPGSRLEPQAVADDAGKAGFRIIGVDRPGYGGSTPVPGRSIGSWVPDAVTLAEHLDLGSFTAVGCSTGGAYALALAALEADRVEFCVACCALTDMRWAEGRAMMTEGDALGRLVAGIWDAPDRDSALRHTTEVLGADGSGLLSQAPVRPFPPADIAVLTDPVNLAGYAEASAEMFHFGVQGFTDDRLADGVGWVSFDVNRIKCPTMVLHGAVDPIVAPSQAQHTASLVPGAALRVIPGLGHFSISAQVVPVLKEMHGAN